MIHLLSRARSCAPMGAMVVALVFAVFAGPAQASFIVFDNFNSYTAGQQLIG